MPASRLLGSERQEEVLINFLVKLWADLTSSRRCGLELSLGPEPWPDGAAPPGWPKVSAC